MKILLSILLMITTTHAFEHKFFQSEIPATDFNNVTVSQAIQALQRKSKDIQGSKSGFNYVFSTKASKKLNQKISISLTVLPLDDAIKYTAMVSDLRIKFEAGTVLFMANGEKYKDPIVKDKFTRFSPQMLHALKLKIDDMNFEGTKLSEAGKTIQKSARAIDPQKKGVNLLIINANPKTKVTMNTQGLPIYSLLKYMAFSAGVTMKMERAAIIFTSAKGK